MGVLLEKEEDRNVALSKKINADLRARAAAEGTADPNPDSSDDASAYLENYDSTGRFAWVWFVLIALAIASLVFIILL